MLIQRSRLKQTLDVLDKGYNVIRFRKIVLIEYTQYKSKRLKILCDIKMISK